MFKTSITPEKRPVAATPSPATVPPLRPQSRGGSRAATIWTEGASLRIDGPVSGDCDLMLNGVIVGDVNVAGLTVDETGSITGRVTAGRVEIRGRVIGDVHADVLKLCARAHVEGDLTYRELSIEPGAHFQGRVVREVPAPAPEPVVQALPEPEAVEAPAEVEADAFAIPYRETAHDAVLAN